MSIVLNEDQIEYLIDFIEPRKGIPEKIAKSLMEKTKDSLRKQLEGKYVYPEIIPSLKDQLFLNWKNSCVQPGESVGILCAQSIGEKNTQTALNTFHKAGQSEKTMTEGVPRFQELLNATRNPKIVNHKIFFKKENSNIKSLRNIINNQIVGITMKDIILNCDIIMNKTPENWYEIYKILYNIDLFEHKSCICFKLNTHKMYEFKISYEKIKNIILNEYEDVVCAFSPFNDSMFYVFPFTDNVEDKIHNQIAYITKENAIEIYIEDVVQPAIENIFLCGVNGINEIFYTKNNDEWFIETNSESCDLTKNNIFSKLLALEDVDEYRTISNNIWEIYKTLGVEATRNFLIEEFLNIMDGINSCHAELLVNRMTFNGNIDSISRYTLKSDQCGPMGKASFEESLDNFLNAASNGEVEPTDGVSASIICGKRSNIGTGMMSLSMELKKCF
jgi:DNA-directed RNA polymerase II subunit RPB1